ncbi:MFS transporter [Nocardia yunnanensis]|uniref:MFS transporter n=1 Tax=Nocardia yunnanensis TaxID=2382165 RepID=A0A386ZAU2_9NOCA|nr:MFS transporter [Nocardia yunnanensis]AYF74234.1 MFS transporter [Nocardia yunnanensis]
MTSTAADTRSDPTPALGRTTVLVFAITAGSSAAGNYYLQPLLHEVAGDLRISTATAALLVSAAQIGYLCGLAFLVPLGDFLRRHRMVPALLLASVAALLVSAFAPNFAVLFAGVIATGVTASAAQVVVPWASALAHPERRGQVVGTVMSGLLLGILLSRVLSGAVAQLGGWRAVLLVAAGLQVVMAVSLYLLAPATPRAAAGESYPQVLSSIVALIKRHPILRQRMALGFVVMGCFSLVWTAIAFLLAGARGSSYHYSEFTIGLFGLAGVLGALGAPVVGRLADRGHLRRVTTLTWLVLLASWALVAWGGHSVLALIVALLVFDFGIQGSHLTNQSAIYALDPAARSRLTTAYMVTYFLGGVAGSVTAGVAYQLGGWALVCGIGAAATAVGLLLWAVFAVGPQQRPAQPVMAAGS